MTEDARIQAVEKRIPLICLAEHCSANQKNGTHIVNLADRELFKMRYMQEAAKVYRNIPDPTASSSLLFITALLL